MAKLQLRPATAGDAERLLEIYAPYVEKTAPAVTCRRTG